MHLQVSQIGAYDCERVRGTTAQGGEGEEHTHTPANRREWMDGQGERDAQLLKGPRETTSAARQMDEGRLRWKSK